MGTAANSDLLISSAKSPDREPKSRNLKRKNPSKPDRREGKHRHFRGHNSSNSHCCRFRCNFPNEEYALNLRKWELDLRLKFGARETCKSLKIRYGYIVGENTYLVESIMRALKKLNMLEIENDVILDVLIRKMIYLEKEGRNKQASSNSASNIGDVAHEQSSKDESEIHKI